MTRAVLDANVLVSAILSPHGAPAQVLLACRAQAFDLLISPASLDELDRVLRYPKLARRHGWSKSERRAFLFSLAAFSIPTPGNLTVRVVEDDPDDDRYLACATEGGADYIVSGDRHLLEIREYQGIPILTPRAFLTILGEGPPPTE
jgi:putative PIN family toxin of toxin-antitoxin system